jgi:cell division protease FtsH
MVGPDVEEMIDKARYTGPTVGAAEVIGLGACMEQLKGQLALMERPDLGVRFGLEPSGTLFIGAPGTGKTLLARYLAGALSRPLYQFSADQFQGQPAVLHAVFERLRGERAILFIDEISILAQKREWGDAEDRRSLIALLTCLDGLSNVGAADRLWVIGACTPDIQLDPALQRSGRLGVTIEFALPSEEHRRLLFRLYLHPVPHRVGAGGLRRLAHASMGTTGADIRDWVNQAASLALVEKRDRDPLILYRHLEAVVSRRGFVAANDRPGRAPDWETCVHEAAHAVAALTLFGEPSLGELSVGVARVGDGLSRGRFVLADAWAAVNPPTSLTWRDHVAVSLAGAAAEEVILGYRGAGAQSDVAQATETILELFETGDPLFGPGRRTAEGSGVRAAGAEVMRTAAWFLLRQRFDECWIAAERLAEGYRPEIERLARTLLDGRWILFGRQIAEAAAGSPPPDQNPEPVAAAA